MLKKKQFKILAEMLFSEFNFTKTTMYSGLKIYEAESRGYELKYYKNEFSPTFLSSNEHFELFYPNIKIFITDYSKDLESTANRFASILNLFKISQEIAPNLTWDLSEEMHQISDTNNNFIIGEVNNNYHVSPQGISGTVEEVIEKYWKRRRVHEQKRGVKTSGKTESRRSQEELNFEEFGLFKGEMRRVPTYGKHVFWMRDSEKEYSIRWKAPVGGFLVDMDELSMKHLKNILKCVENPEKYSRIHEWSVQWNFSHEEMKRRVNEHSLKSL